MLRPVQIGRTNQLTKIIRSATAHPIVRSESAPVDNMLNKPIDTPKFQAKLIIQPMYLGIFPASSKPSGRPVGRIFSGLSLPAPFAFIFTEAGLAALGVAFFATAFAA